MNNIKLFIYSLNISVRFTEGFENLGKFFTGCCWVKRFKNNTRAVFRTIQVIGCSITLENHLNKWYGLSNYCESIFLIKESSLSYWNHSSSSCYIFSFVSFHFNSSTVMPLVDKLEYPAKSGISLGFNDWKGSFCLQ